MQPCFQSGLFSFQSSLFLLSSSAFVCMCACVFLQEFSIECRVLCCDIFKRCFKLESLYKRKSGGILVLFFYS